LDDEFLVWEIWGHFGASGLDGMLDQQLRAMTSGNLLKFKHSIADGNCRGSVRIGNQAQLA
jgi:hypothetical protein